MNIDYPDNLDGTEGQAEGIGSGNNSSNNQQPSDSDSLNETNNSLESQALAILASTPEQRALEEQNLSKVDKKNKLSPEQQANRKHLNKVFQAPKASRERDIKQRVSQRLLISKQNESVTIVCEVTGIVSVVNIPQIPYTKTSFQRIMVWPSPLSDIRNCRGLAQAGLDYLRFLDTQVLAGILIVLAADYDLFRYQPSDSGAQKNAILRAAGKDTLIDCILFIEDYLHSHNHKYIPKLSLILTADLLQGAITSRMTEWLKAVNEIISAGVEEEEEDNYYSKVPEKKMTPDFVKAKAKKQKSEAWTTQNAAWKIKREYTADLKAAKANVVEFAKNHQISLKLKTLLLQVFTDDTLLTITSDLKSLIINKLSEYGSSPDALAIIAALKKDRAKLSFSLDDDIILPAEGISPQAEVQAEPETEETGPEADSLENDRIRALARTNEEPEENEEEDSNPLLPGQIAIEVEHVTFHLDAANWNSKTAIEKIKYKRFLKAQFPEYFTKEE